MKRGLKQRLIKQAVQEWVAGKLSDHEAIVIVSVCISLAKPLAADIAWAKRIIRERKCKP